MLRNLFLSILIFAALPAVAATPDTSPPAVMSRPIATGTPHLCLEYYPPLAKQFDVQGITTVRFTIAEDGSVRDPQLRTTSGSELLDQASLDCVKTWTYIPAKKNADPIAVPWVVEIKWYLHHNFEGPAEPQTPDAKWLLPVALLDPPHQCQASFNSLAGQISASGPTSLFFTIKPDGSTTDVVVTRSSGNDVYDKTASDCIKRWRYAPGTRDGVPVSIHWLARVEWGNVQP